MEKLTSISQLTKGTKFFIYDSSRYLATHYTFLYIHPNDPNYILAIESCSQDALKLYVPDLLNENNSCKTAYVGDDWTHEDMQRLELEAMRKDMCKLLSTLGCTSHERRKHDGLAKHNYPNWHEMKDLTAIYNEQEWDDAEVIVWDPELGIRRKLVFCGSTRPNDEHVGEINFTVTSFDNKNRNYNED